MLVVLTIPLSQFLMFMIFDMRFIGIHDGELWTTKYNLSFCLLTIVAYGFCFAADILASRAFLSIVKNTELKASVDALEYKNQLNLQYYSELKQNETELRKIRHDFYNVMQVMGSLLEVTDAPEAQKLYEELNKQINGIHIEYFCENSFVNAVIANKAKLCRENGMTVVLITHHMDECIDADRLIVMSNGRITADGNPAEVFSHVSEMEKEGLDVPETVRIVHDLNGDGYALPTDALHTEACADAIAAAIRQRRTAWQS